MNDILSYDPFLAFYVGYDGCGVKVTFCCPYCSSSSCVRAANSRTDNFFEGHFRCKVCRKGSVDRQPFNYASRCFITSKLPIYEQLTLF